MRYILDTIFICLIIGGTYFAIEALKSPERRACEQRSSAGGIRHSAYVEGKGYIICFDRDPIAWLSKEKTPL